MWRIIGIYVHTVDRCNHAIGRVMMYGLFGMIAILLWSSLSKAIFTVPAFWTLEMAQFALVAYYLVGGPYSIQLRSNVRMDLFYGNWSEHKKACFDSFSVFFLILFLAVLLYGGINSLLYAIEYNERSPTLWRPLMWPVKLVMNFGIFLMLLQAISEFFKDFAKMRGVNL